ncbi:MAG: bifunctional DNA-formamidopyrimidine glycosylase/DNA-(apurinic or apyrimidinic site) lyase [Actinobacteria bacterium]|nr:bifunctional DNA-formamidopyrimidine glycosylase/DNA-(apurinic or apyrimidinic site) lyase [Actinomycetota bacterium]
MPELPEVETIRRQLAPVIEGRAIAAACVRDPKWVQPVRSSAFERGLTGRTIVHAGRRGKYFSFKLDDGAFLIMHLRMTGNLLYLSESAAVPEKYLRGTLTLDGGAALAFVDPRRFGTALVLADADQADGYFAARLGPEPFDTSFSGDLLHAVTRGRKTSIKAVLLDQRTVAGVGNIYADEALYRAGISPRRRASRLTKAQCERLGDGVRAALRAGIDAKGASIDDFRDAYGVRGSFQDQFLVHRREGLPCPSCGLPVTKTVVAGRGTYFCRDCQRD